MPTHTHPFRRWVRALWTTPRPFRGPLRHRLGVEPLEDRVVPAADWSEPNDSQASATYLGRAGNLTWNSLSIDTPTDVDWIAFRLDTPGATGNTAGINFTHANGDLDIALYNSAGTFLTSSTGVSDNERVSLAGLGTGVYFLKVYGFAGATNTYTFVTSGAAYPPGTGDFLEPNNDSWSAFPIPSIVGGFSMNGMGIHSSSDIDWFQLRLLSPGTASSLVRINFTHANGDLDMALYAADGTTLVGFSGGVSDSETISLNGMAAGTYYVKVYGFAGATNPGYTLFATGPAAGAGDRFEVNDSPALATNLGILTGPRTETGLSVHTPTDVDYYKIQLASAGTPDSAAEIDFTHANGDLDMALYAADGTTLVGYSAGVGNSERISFAGLAAGTYFVRVYGYAGAINAYTLTLTPPTGPAPDALETNDSVGTATNLGTAAGILSQTDLSIHSTTDVDYFRFTLASPAVTGDQARIDFIHAAGDLDMALYAADGTTFLNSSTGVTNSETIDLAGLPAGTYYLKVYGFLGAINPNYALTVSGPSGPIPDALEPNDTQATATNLDAGGIDTPIGVTNLSIHSAADADYFRFTLAAPGVVGNQAVVAFSHAAGDIDVQLLNPAGDVLATSQGVTDTETISLAGLAAGTYLLKVYGFLGATNPTYALNITRPTAPTGPGPDPYEADDTFATAANLGRVVGPSPFVAADLSIHTTTDVDWYRFETVAPAGTGHQVQIAFAHALGDLDMVLYQADGTTIAGASTGTGNTETISLAGLPAGVYFLKVYGFAGATNPNYALSIVAPAGTSLGPDRLEPNDSAAAATLLRTGAGTTLAGTRDETGLTITAGDADFFRFTTVATGTAADSVNIAFLNANGDLTLQLLGADGTTVLATSAGTSDGESISLAGQPAGTYFARVVGAGPAVVNTYDLRVNAPNAVTNSQDAWTLMVYITASTLEPFAFADINEMEAAVAQLPGTVNITVLWDQSSGGTTYPTGNGTQAAWGTAGRAVLTGDTDRSRIRTTFELLGEQDTGSPTTLQSFIQWSAQQAPAQHYALMLWDHGGGIDGFNYDNLDGTTSDHLTPPELVSAVNGAGVPIGVIGFDACLMAMGEVAYSLRNAAPVVVGSEEVEDGPGHDYTTLLNVLGSQDPYQVSPEALGSGIVQSYGAQYVGQPGNSDTYSAVRSSDLGAVATALSTFVNAVGTNPSVAILNAVRNARNAATAYADDTFRDLGRFMTNVASNASLPTAIRNAATAVNAALAAAIISKTQDDRASSGLALYMPQAGGLIRSDYTTTYAGFTTATGWNTFLQVLTTGSAPPRGLTTPDWSEANDTRELANNLGTLSGPDNIFTDLNLHLATDQDWFSFNLSVAGTAGSQVSVTPGDPNAVIEVALFDAAGNLLGGGTGSHTVGLAGQPAGTYFVRVRTTGLLPVDSYTLDVDAPALRLSADPFGDNSTQAKAYNLGSIGSLTRFNGMFLPAGSQDWFTFDVPVNLNGTPYQLTLNTSGNAQLTAEVRDATGTLVSSGSSRGTAMLGFSLPTNASRMSLHVAGNPTTDAGYSMLFQRAGNTAPTISNLSDITVPFNGSSGPIPFSIGDADTTPTALDVGVTVDNPALLSVALGGFGANRTVTVTPVAGMTGSTTVRLTVTDAGGLNTTDTFVATVPSATSPPPPSSPPVPDRPGLVGFPQFGVGADAGAGTVRFFNPDGSARTSATPFSGLTGGVRTAAADFTGDGVADLVVGTGPGGPTHIQVLDGADGHLLFAVDPFEAAFVGGVYVSAGDLNGDGVADLVVTPDEGGGPRVTVYSGRGFTPVANFFGIDDPAFRGGARSAVGDFNGDGVSDLVVAAGFGGGPRVAVFDGTTVTTTPARLFGDFFLFEPALRNGAFVTVGDVDGDGRADMIGGGGPGGGPRVLIFSGADLLAGMGGGSRVLANFFAGNTANRGGVRVAAKNLDGDNRADLVVGDGAGAGSHVTAYLGKNFAGGQAPKTLDFDAFPGFNGGVFVG